MVLVNDDNNPAVCKCKFGRMLVSKHCTFILGNRTHDHAVASAMIYYRNVNTALLLLPMAVDCA